MKKIRFEFEAEQEASDAEEQSTNPSRFVGIVSSALDLLANGLTTGSSIGVSHYRCWILRGLPYSLIYREEPMELVIVAFAHHKRKPGYWKRRLKP